MLSTSHYYLSIYLSIYLSMYLSIYLSMYLSQRITGFLDFVHRPYSK
jgi:hypothetical protein